MKEVYWQPAPRRRLLPWLAKKTIIITCLWINQASDTQLMHTENDVT